MSNAWLFIMTHDAANTQFDALHDMVLISYAFDNAVEIVFLPAAYELLNDITYQPFIQSLKLYGLEKIYFCGPKSDFREVEFEVEYIDAVRTQKIMQQSQQVLII